MSISSIVWSPGMSTTPSHPGSPAVGLPPASAPSSSFPTSHNRTHLPPLSSLMASSSFPSNNSRHTANASLSQNFGVSASFTNHGTPPLTAPTHIGHISRNDHQHKKRRLSPPIAHDTGPASMGYEVSVYHSRGSHPESHLQGHPEQNISREGGGDTDTEMTAGRGEDESQSRRASPSQGLPMPRRRPSGSSPAAVARHSGPNTRAPPSMSTSMLTSAASTQAVVTSIPTEQSGAGANKQWKTPTGHRRGITAKEMLPLDAPTQPRRRSVTTNGGGSRPTSSSGVSHPQSPSTSFSIPAPEEQVHGTLRAVKRPHTSSSAAESISPAHSSNLSLDLEPDASEYDSPSFPSATISPPLHGLHPAQSAPPLMQRSNVKAGASDSPASAADPSLVEDPVALKRRQNTIAARRSRQRKLEHVRSLEKQVDGLTRERDELRSRVARLEDRVAFLKEIVAGSGGNAGPVATSPRVVSRGARQLSGKRAAATQWDNNDADELYDDDTGRRDDDEEYDDEY